MPINLSEDIAAYKVLYVTLEIAYLLYSWWSPVDNKNDHS